MPPKQTHIYDYYIDERGDWLCEGNPVTDPDLFRLLSRSLFQDKSGYFVRCEGEVHPVRVSDAPLWIRYIHAQQSCDGKLLGVEIELQDGRREPLAPETLTISNNDALYCLATARRMKARFGKVAYYELTRHVEMEENEEKFHLSIDGRRYDIQMLDL